MKIGNYYKVGPKLYTTECFDFKKNINISKIYDKFGGLSSIDTTKDNFYKGLYIFYSNNLSNQNEIHGWWHKPPFGIDFNK